MTDDVPEEPVGIRMLRRLVTVLTGVMIVGMVVIVGLLISRFNQSAPLTPEALALPDDVTPLSITFTGSWIGVVSTDGRFLVYDRLTGMLRQEIKLDLP